MKNIFKSLGLSSLALVLVVGLGVSNAGTAYATTTYAVNAITETGALTVTSAGALGLVAGANAINIGADATAKTITIGNGTGAAATVLNFGTGNLDINGTGASADFTLDADLFSIDGTGTANVTVTGAVGEDFTVAQAGAADASLIISSTGTGADALQITTSAGGLDISVTGTADTEDLNLTAVGATTEMRLTSASTEADAIDILTSGTAGGIDIDTTDGAITIDAAGADNGDLTITVGDNFTLDGAGGSVYAIGGSTTSGTITLGGASMTAATTLYGGSATRGVSIVQNLAAVTTESHGLSVTSTGTLESGENLVGVNSVTTPAGTGANWVSGVYGKVDQNGDYVTGYISGGEFEVDNSSATAQNEMFPLVLDSNSAAYHPNSAYIWGQDFGAAKMPNLLKITGTTIGTGNMVQTSADTDFVSTHSLKIMINGTAYYIPISTSQAFD